MSANDDTAIKGTNAHTVITDMYNNPVTIDNNVAHIDGLMYEINSYVRRTGTWDSLITHGVSLQGSKIIIDSAAAVPFVSNTWTISRAYSVNNPCPHTSQRLVDYNLEQAKVPGSVPRVSPTKLPDDGSASQYSVNPFIIDRDDLALGNAIARCFEDADLVENMRLECGMGGRALLSHLVDLAQTATAAEKTLVLRRYNRFAEAPVAIDLDTVSFNEWLKDLMKMHRRLPQAVRKTDDDICESINALFFAQPSWREMYEIRTTMDPTISGDLKKTLVLIRKMLSMRGTYAHTGELRATLPSRLPTTCR